MDDYEAMTMASMDNFDDDMDALLAIEDEEGFLAGGGFSLSPPAPPRGAAAAEKPRARLDFDRPPTPPPGLEGLGMADHAAAAPPQPPATQQPLPPPRPASSSRPRPASSSSSLRTQDVSIKSVLDELKKSHRIYAYPPRYGTFVGATDAEGGRLYLSIRTEKEARAAEQVYVRKLSNVNKTCMLTESIEELERQIDALNMERGIEQAKLESEKELDQVTPVHGTALWVDKYAPRSFIDLISPGHTNRQILLWLKRWDATVFPAKAAKRAGPEISRPARKLNDALNVLSPHTRRTDQRRFKRRRRDDDDDDVDNDMDEDGLRPLRKIALLSGPPGLGKTTLAHVIAKQAGYKVIEVNASDDRNAKTLTKHIRTVTEMQPAFGARPNCLILDEIDGAADGSEANSAIPLLVKLALGQSGEDAFRAKRQRGENDFDVSQQGTKKKKKATLPPLKRPIICICNNLYAPVLRPLREVAEIFRFEPPQKQHLVERLRLICRREGLEADTRALSALVDTVKMDIRSCINTLQFVHSREMKLTLSILAKLNIAQKDVAKDSFSIWDSVLCNAPKRKSALDKERERTRKQELKQRNRLAAAAFRRAPTARRRRGGASGPVAMVQTDASAQRWAHIVSDMLDNGDLDKLLQGVFENYLSTRFNDPTFGKIVESTRWMSHADLFRQRVLKLQDYAMMAYVPFGAVGVHHMIAGPRKVKLRLPSAEYALRTVKSQNEDVLEEFMSDRNTLRRNGITAKAVVMDVVSPLLDLVAPRIRAASHHAMNANERAVIDHTVSIMMDSALTFRQEYGVAFGRDVASSFRLHPAIDRLCAFDWRDAATAHSGGIRSGRDAFLARQQPKEGFAGIEEHKSTTSADARRAELPTIVKEIISREVDIALMRRSEEARRRALEASAKAEAVAMAGGSPARSRAAASGGATQTPEVSKRPLQIRPSASKAALAAAAAAANKAAAKGTEGEPVSIIAQYQRKYRAQATLRRNPQTIHFKFNEGHTSAVRRTISTVDLCELA